MSLLLGTWHGHTPLRALDALGAVLILICVVAHNIVAVAGSVKRDISAIGSTPLGQGRPLANNLSAILMIVNLS